MSKNDNKQKMFLSIGEAQRFTGLGQSLLRKIFKEGIVKGYTSPAGQRRYNIQSLQEFCNINDKSKEEQLTKVNYLYARVSSKKQSDDLERQVKFLQEWTADKGITYNVIEDIGSGINFKRKGIQTILDRCVQGVIGNVTVAHRDRLSRFGFDLIESFITKAGGTITVIEDNRNISSEQELAEDLLSIVHIYSCRQMGKRSYSSKTKTKRNNENINTNVLSNTGTEKNVGQESTC